MSESDPKTPAPPAPPAPAAPAKPAEPAEPAEPVATRPVPPTPEQRKAAADMLAALEAEIAAESQAGADLGHGRAPGEMPRGNPPGAYGTRRSGEPPESHRKVPAARDTSTGVPEAKMPLHDSGKVVSLHHDYPSGVKEVDTQAKMEADAGDPPIVKFTGVTKIFGDGPTAFTAIKDVNFVVDDIPDKGEFISILGPSGCGKSTILRLIAALEPQHPPSYGEVLVDGKPVTSPGSDRGMVFQDYTSFDNRSVLDNVAFGLECRGVSRGERHELARTWIDKVGLSVKHDSGKYPHQLSGGMRQRVAIARTLILSPRIILMDEPFGALDPTTRMNMQDNLVALWRELEATVFFVTHSIEEAVYLGDRIYLLSSSPGTILQELEVPPPDRPAKEMQRQDEFQDIVFNIRDTIEVLESSQRAGDD